VSLSQVIAKLEPDETLRFTRQPQTVQFVLRKSVGENQYKEVAFVVDLQGIECAEYDLLASSVDYALRAIRQTGGK
jgi:hypothetical protein